MPLIFFDLRGKQFMNRYANESVKQNLVAKMSLSAAATRVGSRIIFVGASTGGTEAITKFLRCFPVNCPPVLIVQHMPELFTGTFAHRLNSLCAPHVVESVGEETLQAGTIYIAPGHSHMRIKRSSSGAGYMTELSKEEPVNRHRPSVDVLFNSAAETVGATAIGVILTGMGKDGATGLLRMRQAGAHTFGQDEESCVVYGMPREAAKIGAVGEVFSLKELPKQVLALVGKSTI